MTIEEAIKILEYPVKKWSMEWDEREDGLSYYEDLDLAISALRQQDIRKNDPLILDELRQMDGEPVWCEIYIKGQPSFYGIVHKENVTGFIPGDDKPANLAITNVGAYGLAWLAYRQKPEEGTV